MNKRRIILTVGCGLLWGLPTCPAELLLARSVDRNQSLTNAPITVTARFTNTAPTALRGLFYSDQIPVGLAVATVSVTLDGQAVANYQFEFGVADDVHPDCTPCRWIFEEPPGFAELNPLPQSGIAEIVYTVNSPTPGSFSLPEYTGVAFESNSTQPSFGTSPLGAAEILQFVTAPPPHLTLAVSNQLVRLTFPTQADVTYRVEFSDELGSGAWLPLAEILGTGSTVTHEETLRTGGSRFYRVVVP